MEMFYWVLGFIAGSALGHSYGAKTGLFSPTKKDASERRKGDEGDASGAKRE